MSCVEVTLCESKCYNIGDEDNNGESSIWNSCYWTFLNLGWIYNKFTPPWEIWKYDFTLYTTTSGITQDSQKLALLLHIGGTEVKEIYRTVKDSQHKYNDVVHKLDVHSTLKKNLSCECYSFKICKQKPDEDCSAYITPLKGMGETSEYENLNTEVQDQFIMSCKSTKIKEELLLEQDLTLAKLVDICRNLESVKIQVTEMDGGTKESVSSNRKPPKKIGKLNLVKPQNTEKSCYKCGEKYQKGNNEKCKAIDKTCYNCGKTNHLSNVCKSKQKQVSKINKTEHLETKNSANRNDEADSAQEVFTFSLSSNYANEIPNQPISSIKSEHVAKTKIYQPIENENVNSIQLKHKSLTINEVSVKFLIDTGSSIDT